jgi:hypothetical protein
VHAGPWRYLSLIVFHDKRRSIGNVERTKSVYRITIGRHWRRPRSGAHPGWAEWVPHRQVHLRGLGGSPKRVAIDDLDRLRAEIEILKQPCVHLHLEFRARDASPRGPRPVSGTMSRSRKSSNDDVRPDNCPIDRSRPSDAQQRWSGHGRRNIRQVGACEVRAFSQRWQFVVRWVP